MCDVSESWELIEDDLNKRSANHANKSTLVARGADAQLGFICVLAPLATNVNLWNPIMFLWHHFCLAISNPTMCYCFFPRKCQYHRYIQLRYKSKSHICI